MWVYIVFSVDGYSERVDAVFTDQRKAEEHLENKRKQYSHFEYRIGHYFAI